MPITLLVLLLLFFAREGEASGQLPKPSGAHCVGKIKMRVLDDSRLEEFSEAPDDFRELVLDAWYPGTCVGKTASYIHLEVLDAYKKRAQIADAVDLSFVSKMKTNTYIDSKVDSTITTAPVVVFSHGAGMPMELYTNLYEGLASSGYFVFVISHTFEAAAVEFPDGRIVLRNEEFSRRQFTDAVVKEWNDLVAFVNSDAALGDKLNKTRKVFDSDFPGTMNVKRRARDISFVLGKIADLNKEKGGRFFGKLDLKRVGGLGHSFGGAAMGQAILTEKRIRAAVNLDGWQFGEMAGRELKVPFLYARRGSEQPDAFNDVIYSQAGSMFVRVKVEGALHENFSDLPLFAASNEYFKTGSLEAGRSIVVVNDMVRGFFDCYLRGNKKAWESVILKHSELVLESDR